MNLLDREILLVDKPAGLSSFAVVARIRRVLTEQVRARAISLGQTPPKRAKVGHAGTLDPFATGLLICLLGSGTKKAQEFLKLDKKYEATICLGKTSTTGDVEGEIRQVEGSASSKSPLPRISPAQVATIVESFKGEILQKVPIYSAVKINGRRAYDLARKGIDVEMPTREVQIYDIKVLSYEWPYLKISCHVSSGTYIRALGEDIGEKLGVGGYLTELRRTQIGEYKVSEAIGLAELGIID
ncbi:tRNA pseudouridine(55) synthase TruB [Candidatus Saccharibacteria bacterium]|nr:tRNA pseudouridine(55) synthase TruB [Candidatus Saccharibacteria bacterium]